MNISYPPELPISLYKDDIALAIKNNQVLIISGDTGSGKTTQIPKICLEAGQGQNGMIGCTQPRRIAAVSIAERVKEELNNDLLVGYKIRFHNKTRDETIIKFMTDGVLLAETSQDHLFRKYDTIIIDEAHERSLNIDFLLGILKQKLIQRPDLKLIISSATIDTEKFSSHFSNAPVFEIPGRSYPITIQYSPLNEDNLTEQLNYVEHAVNEVVKLFNYSKSGDILIFMPSERDIRDCVAEIKKQISPQSLVLPLFGRLQAKDQRRIFNKANFRKIIVASNIAETSITVPGIKYVIDTGLARISKYNVRAKTTSLLITKISKASCDQRTGRCGRTESGTCIRLFSEADYLARQEFTLPEIQRANLAEVILQMIYLRLGDPRNFPYVDNPSPRSINDGYKTLYELGALKKNNLLSKKGEIMARLPLDPCISKIIVEGASLGALKEVKIIAAALSIMDPRIRPAENEKKADAAHLLFLDKSSDFISYLNIWDNYQRFIGVDNKQSSKLRKFCKKHYLSWQRMREWFDIHEQITRLLQNKKQFKENGQPAPAASIHQALTSGFLRNICQKKEKNFYKTSGNREVMIFPGSSLFNKGGQWIVSASFIETSRLYARIAANIEVGWLEEIGGDLCKRSWSSPHWEKKTGQVTAFEKVTLFGMIIESGRRVNYGRINHKTAEEARDIFIRSALIEGKLGGNYTFLQHNLALTGEFEDMEERVRKRNILVDEQTIYHFYDKYLDNVYDRFTLNRYLRKKQDNSFLFMSAADLCREQPDQEKLYKFPAFLRANNLRLNLTYRFQPGHDEDGVSVDIPVVLLDNINPAIFEWVVPGLLPEKILWLLKSLPKRIRKRLVPLPEAVDYIIDSLDLYNGSLYPALEKSILQKYQVTIQRTEWQINNLPLHLRLNYRIINENDRVLNFGRVFQDLINRCNNKPKNNNLASDEIKLPFKDRILSWDFKGIEPKLSVYDRDGNTAKLYFASLFINLENKWLELRYIDDLQESRKLNNEGMLFLYKRQFAKEIKAFAKECKDILSVQTASLLSLGFSANFKTITNKFSDFILKDIFDLGDGSIHSENRFYTILKEVKTKGFFQLARPKTDHLIGLISQKREVIVTLDEIKKRARITRSYRKEQFEMYEQLIDTVLPGSFFETMTVLELQHTNRYLQAIKLRMIRAEQSPGKDVKKAERLHSAANRLKLLKDMDNNSDTECQKCIYEYRRMFEEFKVSIFAPELGTAVVVSEKRLKQKWLQVLDKCKKVE